MSGKLASAELDLEEVKFFRSARWVPTNWASIYAVHDG